MNCKPGDIAVIIDGENAGRFVDVLPEPSYQGFGWWRVRAANGQPFVITFGGPSFFFPEGNIEDRRLRPIRPGDISDEEVRDLYAPKLPEVAHV